MRTPQSLGKVRILIIIIAICFLLTSVVEAGVYYGFKPPLNTTLTGSYFEQNPSLWAVGGRTYNSVAYYYYQGMEGSHFDASPTSGPAPLEVHFVANSPARVADYAWDFGDGTFGTGPNPDHTYTQPGTYTVKLTVRQAQVRADSTSYFSIGQESTWQKDNMIQVTGQAVPSSGSNLPKSAAVNSNDVSQSLSALQSSLSNPGMKYTSAPAVTVQSFGSTANVVEPSDLASWRSRNSIR